MGRLSSRQPENMRERYAWKFQQVDGMVAGPDGAGCRRNVCGDDVADIVRPGGCAGVVQRRAFVASQQKLTVRVTIELCL